MKLLSVVRIVRRRTCSFSSPRAAGETGHNSFRMLQTIEDRVLHPYGGKNLSTMEKKNPLMDLNQKNIDLDYEECIRTLNSLQSNVETIQMAICNQNNPKRLEKGIEFLKRSGLTMEDVDKLSIIHVSGTKGKGSTCAIIESLLRAHGIKTGFFSSPHLVSVTERMRINGQPISKQKFSYYFWPIYRRLKETQNDPIDMPGYFQFLKILCFHVFLEEKVEATVLEVGIGGELDCTNVVRNTKTVGITSLGLEHTQLLGNNLREIAWQKAGIIKPNSNVFTHVTQPVCLEVIQERAKEKNAKVFIVPDLQDYHVDNKFREFLPHYNDIIQLNGSLGIQLAFDWLRNHNIEPYKSFPPNSKHLTDQTITGLNKSHWPGRCQKIQFQNLNLHLDGAHTLESIQVCTKWFKRVTKFSSNPKILIFNRTGTADSMPLLEVLIESIPFDEVCFTPNFSTIRSENRKDIQTAVWKAQEQLERTPIHAKNWQLLCSKANKSDNSHLFYSVKECFEFLYKRFGTKDEIDILVTGSLHLIGATICAFNDTPDCPSRKQ